MSSKDETMILRTVYLPKHLDARFKLYASRSPSSKQGTLLRRLLLRSLKVTLPLADKERDQSRLNETMVLRTVFLSKKLDNEIKKIAFQRSQGKGELMCDLIRGALDRVREKPVLLN